MKLFKLVSLVIVICVSVALPVFAGEMIHVKVNGLVCDFCARALEKVFLKHESVSKISVNLNNGTVDIELKHDHDISDETVSKLITDSGYNVVKIDRAKPIEHAPSPALPVDIND
ncbi:MAG: heavy metal-associated domain-containing protein [bacterium]|nr:heavy metal-associated domain-containing protein [bacterium]